MPLIKKVLTEELRKIFDSQFEDNEGFPGSLEEASIRWSKAVDLYAGKNLTPLSSTTEQANSAFKGQILLINQPTYNGLVQLQNAFFNYALAIAPGMSISNYNGTPPIAPPVLAPIVPLGLSGASAQIIAETITNIIHPWFKTGTATLIPFPNTVIQWQ